MSIPTLFLSGIYPTYDERGRFAGTLQVLSSVARAVDGETQFFYLCRWRGQSSRTEWAHRDLERALYPARVRA